jgi:hypothetical protein
MWCSKRLGALFCIVFLLWSVPAQAAIAFVNSAHGDLTGGGTSVTTDAVSHVSGNALAVFVRWDDPTTTVASITDTAGNTYHSVSAVNNATNTHLNGQWWYAWNITGNASNQLTVTMSGVVFGGYVYVEQFSGVDTASDPLDVHIESFGSGTDLVSGAFTTTAAHTVILIGEAGDNFSGSFSAGLIGGVTGTLSQSVITNDHATSADAYLVVTSAQSSITAAISHTFGGEYSVAVIALKDSSGGGGGGGTPGCKNGLALLGVGCE